MDASRLLALITDDTAFMPEGFAWWLEYMYLDSSGQPRRCRPSAEDMHDDGIFSSVVLESRLTLVNVHQTRLYKGRKTASGIPVDRPTWLALLNRFDIFPSFLELLHSNNGATMIHASDSCENSGAEAAKHSPNKVAPQAFHVGYKTGYWNDNENAIYARCDFATQRSLIFLLSSDSSTSLDRVESLLKTTSEASIFHIIHALQSIHLAHAEQIRWNLDYRVRQLESQTGIAFFPTHRIIPLREEDLKVNNKLTITDQYLYHAAWGSRRIRLHFESFSRHLLEFERLSLASPVRLEASIVRNLRNSCEMKKELAQSQHDQMQELRGRIRNQLEITATLMTQRDTQSNIVIARSAKRDSELMRGIAAVGMVFLPATFVATFFSMIFFRIGDDDGNVHLTVDRRIWLYLAVTVPLTLAIAIWYLAWARRIEDNGDAGSNGVEGESHQQWYPSLPKRTKYGNEDTELNGKTENPSAPMHWMFNTRSGPCSEMEGITTEL